MNKRYWHHIHTKLRPVNYWYLLAIAIIFLILGLVSLRQNNLNALKLRDTVTEVDKNGGDVETALRNLREYVYAHMNTDLATGPTAIRPPVQLKYRYERLVKVEKDRVSAANAKIYNDAQAKCEQQFPNSLSGRGRVPCIEEYVARNGAVEKSIPDSLYKFDFAPPIWSPDLAGWSLVVSLLFFSLFAIRYSMELWLRRSLRAHD